MKLNKAGLVLEAWKVKNSFISYLMFFIFYLFCTYSLINIYEEPLMFTVSIVVLLVILFFIHKRIKHNLFFIFYFLFFIFYSLFFIFYFLWILDYLFKDFDFTDDGTAYDIIFISFIVEVLLPGFMIFGITLFFSNRILFFKSFFLIFAVISMPLAILLGFENLPVNKAEINVNQFWLLFLPLHIFWVIHHKEWQLLIPFYNYFKQNKSTTKDE